jgi:hypothetical protein
MNPVVQFEKFTIISLSIHMLIVYIEGVEIILCERTALMGSSGCLWGGLLLLCKEMTLLIPNTGLSGRVINGQAAGALLKGMGQLRSQQTYPAANLLLVRPDNAEADKALARMVRNAHVGSGSNV